MTAQILLIITLCLVLIAFLFNRKISMIEDRLRLTQDGELRRMLDRANGTIKKLEKKNKQLELMVDIDVMNLYERRLDRDE